MFFGSIPALVTPFEGGRVAEDTFREFVDSQVAEGSNALVPCGTTGEVATLTSDEHRQVVAAAVEAAKGRVPVIAGCGTYSTAASIERARVAADVGADAILVVVPYYNKPSQAGLAAHFTAIADASPLPIVVYNVPSRTVADISVETLAQITNHKNIVAIKDATGNLARVTAQRLACGEDFCQLSGNDDMAWRDGAGCVAAVETLAGPSPVEVDRVGVSGDLLLWRFVKTSAPDPIAVAMNRLRGRAGDLLSRAGLLAAFVDPQGKVIAYNALFGERALGGNAAGENPHLSDLVTESEDGSHFQLMAEGDSGRLLRAVLMPLDPPGPSDYGNFYLFDSPDTLPMSSSSHLQSLLDMLPIGLALVNGDGRFLTMNEAFCQAAGVKGERMQRRYHRPRAFAI